MRQSMTIIVQPSQLGSSLENSIRKNDAVDRFGAGLARVTGLEVPIIEGALTQAPESGFLLIYTGWELDSIYAGQLDFFRVHGPRIVLMDVDRGDLWSGRRERLVTDRYRLAAAVERIRYIDWTVRGPNDGGGGIRGLMSVAERAGMLAQRFLTSDYGTLSCWEHCHGLAEILVHYLTVYEEMGLLPKS